MLRFITNSAQYGYGRRVYNAMESFRCEQKQETPALRSDALDANQTEIAVRTLLQHSKDAEQRFVTSQVAEHA